MQAVKKLLYELDILGSKKVKVIMDKGFYSEENINTLFKDHLKFMIAVKMTYSFVRKELDPRYNQFRSFEKYNEKYELYYASVHTDWRYN